MSNVKFNSKSNVNTADVIYFKAEINYTIVYYSDGRTEIIVKPLKHVEIELKLNKSTFYRIHKSFLVNLGYVTQKPIGFNLHVDNKHILTVARRKRPGLNRVLKNSPQNQTI